ncbi:MAG: lysine exporter LysO family protein [Clostridium sulfidigenes]|uniref:Lysine exporter LysO family protein n=1 Tax=Clostridium sulfidigenes TaxID=318464 RepID=A0A927W8W8_9CLOT|nr:lysine exporter LysO family protein [Clostridium sulfidigenes]
MEILITLILGAIVGYFLKLGEKGKIINGKLQQLGVIFLLFSMGASIGADKGIIKNLPTIGLKSFLFAVATIGVSIVLVYILSEKFMPKENQLPNEESILNAEIVEDGNVVIEECSELLNETCGEDK